MDSLRSQTNPGKLRQVGQQRRSSRNSPARLGRRQKLADLAGGQHFETLHCQQAVDKQAITLGRGHPAGRGMGAVNKRSEEHTSELQSLMRISYAVFCLKKKTHKTNKNTIIYKSVSPQLNR